jgi:hypothetical protein
MQERAYPVIGIYRGQLGIKAVPITPTSIRRFKLMEEDFVRLDFALDTPMHFAIGDYINDDIFGRFVITKEQMPKYNEATGGYEYQLQFDAPYISWRNKTFMLTFTTGGDRVRKEASWTLTATLAEHAAEIVNNLAVMGQTVTVSIDSTQAKHAGEVKCIQYSGISILEAMNSMAEAYECEWWVSGTVIHFGKCESGEGPLMLSVGSNIERMSIADNRNNYASKIWVYGAKTNMPPTYRKTLSFTYTADSGLYRPSKALTSEMFAIAGATEIQMPSDSSETHTAHIAAAGSYVVAFPKMESASLRVPADPGQNTGTPTLNIRYVVSYTYGGTPRTQTIRLVQVEGAWKTRGVVTEAVFGSAVLSQVGDTATLAMPGEADITLQVMATLTNVDVPTDPNVEYYESWADMSTPGAATIEPSSSSASRDITCTNGTDTKVIRFNPNSSSDSEEHKLFSFVTGSAVANEKLTVLDEETYKVPTSFFANEYDDPSSLASIGDNRLRMPTSTGDFLLMDGVTEGNAVERVVVFDDIYPDGKLEVTSVSAKNRTDYTEYEGEIEKATWQWKEYTIGVQLFGGGAFRFSTDYILENVTLQVRFLTPEDVEGDAQEYAGQCLLAGMTFAVRFNRSSGTFTIVRNNDYGAMLPNETLYPQTGDPMVIIGWNSKAISSLGLVADAEQRLQAKAEEYLEAMEQGQFTFDCTMMSSFPFLLASAIEWHTEDDEQISGSDGVLIYVRDTDTYEVYALPYEGMKVCIKHSALKEDKFSRVIGYEYKMDKPYDSPKLTIGETERYSRLAYLEKQITSIK